MDRARHPLPQLATLLAIAAPLLLALCFAVDRTFVEDPAAAGILATERHLFRDVATSHELLDAMIERDEVTWDPTNGVRIGRVLAHLKRSDGPNLLLVGSSQFLVVRDDRSHAGIARRVDTLLEERLGRRATVYNLSLGGMTIAEKTWILEHAVRLLDFDYIVVGMTLWDSDSDDVRPWLSRPRDPVPGSPRTRGPLLEWPSPAAINREMTARLSRGLEESVPFFRHRGAIQRWMRAEAARALGREERSGNASVDQGPRPAAATDAVPVQYSYSKREQERILARMNDFFSTLRAIRSQSGAAIMILLTPFRQDTDRPVYLPPEFYERFRQTVERTCAGDGHLLLDASSLLDRSHFGTYLDGPDAGRIDVLHLDAAGHAELAAAIAASGLFDPSRRSMGSSVKASGGAAALVTARGSFASARPD